MIEPRHFTARELAGMPGMPATQSAVIRAAKRHAWTSRPRCGRGGGREYPLTVLPAPTREHLLRQLAADGESTSTDIISTPSADTTALKEWQRSRAEARMAIVAEIRRLAQAGAGIERAMRTVIELAAAGQLPEHLQRLVPVANAKSGGSGTRTLSRSTLHRWIAHADQGVGALAPKPREVLHAPAWLAPLLEQYRRPQKVSLAAAYEQLCKTLPAAEPRPSIYQVRRLLKKVGRVELQRGRMGPRQLKNIRPFVRRDSTGMWPTDCYSADGHTFDAETAHPLHGRPFRPELTSVIDVNTRRAVGWSAGLAESTWTVADALRNAVEVGGIPALFYVDNGSGYCNAILNGPSIGILARLHTTITHSIAYNSQARGVIERSHQTIWTHGAKEFATYMGAPMDPEAKQKVYKLTRDDIKRSGRSRLLMPWPEFLAWCQDRIDAYNNHPHTSLPRVRDPHTGKLRHQTPNEAWQAAIDEGWQPTTIDRTEADDLFRPYKRATVTRGEVRLFGNIYFSRDLEEYHGEQVIVGYDIHDASRVWIRDHTGRMICVAEFEANKRDYFQQTVVQRAAEERARGRIKRAQAKIDEAELELNPPALIEQQPTLTIPLHIVQPEPAAIPAAAPANARPMFDSDAAQYRWLMQHTDRWTDHDRTWIEDYRFSSEYADIFGDEGEVAASK